ncbi:hypothetical protein LCGC14_0420660 [marine sediment metagenome]|uniref:Uncharacterized protein n=1 Tax=marine sediment metagenome TaxID=412755 RepID=A0A0F9T932_9ZZZZ
MAVTNIPRKELEEGIDRWIKAEAKKIKRALALRKRVEDNGREEECRVQ